MKDFDVLVVGELNVDIILDKIGGLPEIGKEKIAEQLTVTLGSSAAIFASNISILGAKTVFVGKIGKDSHAELVKSSLQAKQVNTNYILETAEHKTGLTIVLNYEMDRANITYPGAMNHLVATEVTDALLQRAKHLHVSSIFMQPGLQPDVVNLFQRAKKAGLTTSLDPQWDPSEKWELDLVQLLPLVDIFLPNSTEFKLLTRSKDVKEGLQKVKDLANVIVIKDGENGAFLWDGKNLQQKAAFHNSQVVDCIGAGDSFNAGFISQFIKNKDLISCLAYGNMAGAINTTGHGGTGAFSSLEEVQAIIRQFKVNNYTF